MFEILSKVSVETERLIIRRAVKTDLHAIYDIHKVDVVNKYLPYSTWQSWSDAEDWLARVERRRSEADAEQFVIQRLTDNEVIGSTIVFSPDSGLRCVEFGYVLGVEHWNQGYMYEAMSAFVPVLIEQLQLNKIRASIESENSGSTKLIKKLGFSEYAREDEEGGVVLIKYQHSVS